MQKFSSPFPVGLVSKQDSGQAEMAMRTRVELSRFGMPGDAPVGALLAVDHVWQNRKQQGGLAAKCCSE